MSPTHGWEDLPYFALVGAPKCATTSVAAVLAEHPQVAFAQPKEPFWFGTDLLPLREELGITTPARYARTFRDVDRPGVATAGEGTTLYLSSPDAVDQLLAARPDARLVVMARDPVEVAHAFHMQMVYVQYEPEPDFATAWAAQEARRHDPPGSCPVPRLFQYREVAGLGRQVLDLVERVPSDQLLVLSHREYGEAPAHVLARLATFLGIDADQMPSPTVMNRAMRLRAPRLARAMRLPAARRALTATKARVPDSLMGPARRIKDSAVRDEGTRAPLPASLAGELAEVFAEDRRLLRNLGIRW